MGLLSRAGSLSIRNMRGPLWSLRILPYPSNDVGGAHGSRLTCNLAAILKNDHRRDAPDTMLCGDVLFGVRVEFDESGTGGKLGRCLLERGRHHLAWPAPGCPEVDDHRDVVTRNVSLKSGASQLRRMRREQRLSALAADGILSQSLGRYAINDMALGTDDMFWLAHEREHPADSERTVYLWPPPHKSRGIARPGFRRNPRSGREALTRDATP